MILSTILLGAALACAFLAVASYIGITRSLDSRGMKTPFPLLGLYLFRNVSRYREMTREHTGNVGNLYYSFVLPMNCALGFSIAALIANLLA